MPGTRSQAAKAASQEVQGQEEPAPRQVPGQEEQPAQQQVPGQPLRPDTRVRRDMVQRSIANLEPRIAAIERKEVMTDLDKASVLCFSSMLETLCSDYKECHYVVVAGLGPEGDYKREQSTFDEH